MNANDAILPTASTDPRQDATRVIRAPRGSQLSCKSWLTEAAYRMIQNNLDPEVAERPQELVVYGGIGKAAMKHNSTRPRVEVDPQTSQVLADGELLSCEPAAVLPMAQRYVLL